ncbi:PREDICTED: F-box protein DOR-like [Brassica oleracea var. oleracea]|uniref:F-box protein DOR-like n=1 Tax=Brassica oleracea var. oleracea TaxID=109376 RepID=UPI0006A6F67C|nr:PREDICTED: F-box protein DOR-like [Brassica oleracea var. oleracea]
MPLKCIARCRSVSKRWASVLRRPDFTELFFTRSLARPLLLLARLKEKEVIFFSTPQPQNLGENVSLEHGYYLSNIINRFFCISHYRILRGNKIQQCCGPLGIGNMTWRLIECDVPHSYPGTKSICINGVLYYNARDSNGDDMVVRFDVRSEKYSFVNFIERRMLPVTLINFQGKLASVRLSR